MLPNKALLCLLCVAVTCPACKSKYGLDPISHEQWISQAQRSALDGKQPGPGRGKREREREVV